MLHSSKTLIRQWRSHLRSEKPRPNILCNMSEHMSDRSHQITRTTLDRIQPHKQTWSVTHAQVLHRLRYMKSHALSKSQKLVMHSQHPKKVESPESAKHQKSQSMTSLDRMKTVALTNWQMKLVRIHFDYSSFKTNWKNDLVNVSHTVNCAQFLCMCAICMHACVPHTLKQWATPIPRQHPVWNCICTQCNILHWSLAATLRSTSTTVLSMMIDIYASHQYVRMCTTLQLYMQAM